jgi:hypothetical protein
MRQAAYVACNVGRELVLRSRVTIPEICVSSYPLRGTCCGTCYAWIHIHVSKSGSVEWGSNCGHRSYFLSEASLRRGGGHTFSGQPNVRNSLKAITRTSKWILKNKNEIVWTGFIRRVYTVLTMVSFF